MTGHLRLGILNIKRFIHLRLLEPGEPELNGRESKKECKLIK